MRRWIALGGVLGAAMSAAAQPSSTGTWKVDGDVQGTPVKMTCVITEAERKLTGTCASEEGDTTARKLTGEVTDKGVAWRFDSEYQGSSITVSLYATFNADGSKMYGSIAVDPLDADGDFVAVRQPAQAAGTQPPPQGL